MIRTAALTPLLAALALGPTRTAAQAPAKTDTPAKGEASAGRASPDADAAAKPAAGPDAAKPQAKGAAAAKPSKAATDLARALTTEPTWNALLDAYASSLTGQISAALGASGKEAASDLREKIRADLRQAVQYERAIEMQARALADHFTTEELATLERFYRGGPGRKLLDVLPEVSREVNDDLRERLSQRVPEIVKKYAPSLAQGGADGPASSGTASGRSAEPSPGSGAAHGPEKSGAAPAKPEGKAGTPPPVK